jgi:hypothetical protein
LMRAVWSACMLLWCKRQGRNPGWFPWENNDSNSCDLVIYIRFTVYIIHCFFVIKKGQRCCHYHTAPVFDGRQWSDTDDQFTQLWMEKTRWIITLW